MARRLLSAVAMSDLLDLALKAHGGLDRDTWRCLVVKFPSDVPTLFNNAGVASSSGETPNTVDAMGDYAPDFVASFWRTPDFVSIAEGL
jgi:hypothetical protein